MAETAVGLVVDKLISFLSEEAKLLRGVNKEVKGIKSELERIQAFLKDADKKAIDDTSVKLWVSELREVAEKIEDSIDEYIQDIAERRENQQEQNSLRRRFVCFLRKVSCFIVKLKPRHEIAIKIQELKEEVLEIKKGGKVYNFAPFHQGSSSTTNSPNKSWSDPRKDAMFLKETEVVGIQSNKKELVARLEAVIPEHVVIALVGMGGIGKTTLANQVFEEAKGTFDCHASISVSQSYNKLELLRTLIKRFRESMKKSGKEVEAPKDFDIGNESDEVELMKKMKAYLQGKSYLVMFDDVWERDFWKNFKNGLPIESGGRGRIVLTTRNVEVANTCKVSSSVHIHHMELLDPKSSLDLFCRKAFHCEDEKSCPIDFKGLSRNFVDKCRGLPLAIVVLGNHLAIIEDYSINSHRLVRQWIAEGFVKPRKGETVEIVAEEHLTELINRSMVQVSEPDRKGGVRSFRVHDIVREFILTHLEDLNFCKVLSESDSYDQILTTRRVSFFPGSYDDSKSGDILKPSRIRSVFSFDEDANLNPLVSRIVSNLKLVKVLDFEDCQGLDVLPDDIGNLFHLRYLSVRGTGVKILPKSIGKLENLETLDLKRSLVYELPVEMNKLCKLRHLLAYHFHMDFSLSSRRGVKIQKGFGNLKALQKLYMVEANAEGVNVVEEVSKLKELRKLGMSKLRGEDGKMLCECIQGLKLLESLELYSISEDEVLDCESISSPPQSLRYLALHGRLRKFPEWITKLGNLVKMSVNRSKLEEDPLKSLCHLPSLLCVRIQNDAFYGEKLQFEKEAFPKLKKLVLYSLSMLSSLVIEEGALPNLETLSIGPCPQLKEVPSGLHHLSTLKLLQFWELPLHLLLFNNFESLVFVPQVEFWFTLNNGNKIFCDLEGVLEIQQYVKEHREVDWNSTTSFEEICQVVWEQ